MFYDPLKDSFVGSCIGYGAYMVGKSFSDIVSNEPFTYLIKTLRIECEKIITTTHGAVNGKVRATSQNVFALWLAGQSKEVMNPICDSLRECVVLLKDSEQTIQTMKWAAMRSAFWTGGVEAIFGIFSSLARKEPRPLVIDLLEGGLRGAVLGMGAGISSGTSAREVGAKAISGLIVGYTAGIAGAFIGALVGKVFRLTGEKFGCDHKVVQISAGSVFLLLAGSFLRLKKA